MIITCIHVHVHVYSYSETTKKISENKQTMNEIIEEVNPSNNNLLLLVVQCTMY